MDVFDQLAALPGVRRLFDLAWRTFGVNPALVSLDGARSVIYDTEAREQPFCRALQGYEGGPQLCAMCDQSKFLEARRNGQAVRYRCHAGLREFVIPVIRERQVVALLQCGQVHDRQPSAKEWETARKSLIGAGIHAPALRRQFHRNRVLEPQRQSDLLDLLELIAARLAHSEEHELRTVPSQNQVALGRAITFIETHLSEPLSVESIARAAGISTRSLMRLFQREISATVVDFILRRRITRARQQLLQGGRTCTEIAFECGFGSVQHFNRIFRRFEKTSPVKWRAQRVSQEV